MLDKFTEWLSSQISDIFLPLSLFMCVCEEDDEDEE